MTEASIEARYICVVVIESCPRASEMTLTGTFFDLAMVAQAWRLTYVVSVTGSLIIPAMVLRDLFTRRNAVSYCLRSSFPGRVMTGSRYGDSLFGWRSIISSICLMTFMCSNWPVLCRR